MIVLARTVLVLNAAVIGLIGLAYLYDPNLLLANYGLSADSPGMDNMLRSSYGGLFAAIAVLFALGAVNGSRTSDSLALLALFMGGLAVGRIASIALAGAPDPSMYTLLGYEAAVSVFALFLYRRTADI